VFFTENPLDKITFDPLGKRFARVVRLDGVLVFALFRAPGSDGGGDRRTCCDGGLGVCAGWRGKIFYTRRPPQWPRRPGLCWADLVPDHALVAGRPAPVVELGSRVREDRGKDGAAHPEHNAKLGEGVGGRTVANQGLRGSAEADEDSDGDVDSQNPRLIPPTR
jgi:hypothetical protein